MQGKGPWTGSWDSPVTSSLCSNTGPFSRPVFPAVKRSRLSGKLNKLFIALRMKIWETIVPYRTVVLKRQSLDQIHPHYLEIIRNALISGPILNLLNQKQEGRVQQCVLIIITNLSKLPGYSDAFKCENPRAWGKKGLC